MKKSLLVPFGVVLVLAFTSCDKDSIPTPAPPTIENTSSQRVGMSTLWADCILYGVIAVDNSFKPTAGNFDELYASNNAFKDGVMSISESKPGDTDYNGGRWHVNMLKASVDSTKYMNACSVDDLDLNDFESTNTYFSCPLLPRHQ